MNSRVIHSVLFFLMVLCSYLLHGQEFQLAIQSGHSEPIKLLQFSHNSELLASAGEDKKCIIWELKTRKQLQTIILKSVPQSLFFLSGDSGIMTVEEKKISRWDIISAKCMAIYNHTIEITGCFEDSNGKIVFTDKEGNYVGLHKLNLQESFRYSIAPPKKDTLTYYLQGVSVSRRTLNGYRALPFKDSIIIFNDKLNYAFTLKTPSETEKIPFDKFLTGTKKQALKEQKKIYRRDEKPQKILSRKITKKRRRRVERSIFELNELEKKRRALFNPSLNVFYFTRHSAQVQIDGRKFGFKSGEKNLQTEFFIDSKTPGETLTFFQSSANYLIAGFRKGQLRVYSALDGAILESIKHHRTEINCIAITPDEKYFATCSSDDIILWDMKSFKPIHRFSKSTGSITTFNISQDGNKLLIARSSGQLQYWDLCNNQLISSEMPQSKSSNLFSIKDGFLISDSISEFTFNRGTNYSYRETKMTEFLLKWRMKKNEIELNVKKKHGKILRSTFLNRPEIFVSSYSTKELIKVFENTLRFYSINDTVLTDEIRQAHQDNISCLRLDEQRNLLYSSSFDGTIKIWDLAKKKELSTLLSYGNDFLYMSPENYYYSSKGTVQNVGFRKGLSVYPFEQFDIIYNRPEKVLSLLPFANKEELELFAHAYKKRIKFLAQNDSLHIGPFQKGPTLKILSEKIKSTELNQYKLQLTAQDTTEGICTIKVLVNGIDSYTRKYNNSKIISDSFNIELNNGKNYIQVYATNSRAINSLKEGFYLNQTSEENPNLYVLAIGSGQFNQNTYNLKYPAKDAVDFSESWRKNKTFKKVIISTVVNEHVTLENIKREITNLNAATINDKVLVFFAGHGVLDKDLNYYLSTTEMDFTNPKGSGLLYDSLMWYLQKIPSRYKALFIDACHSGELDKDEMVKTEQKPTEAGNLVFRSVNGTVSQKEGVKGIKKSLEFSKNIFADLRVNNGVSVISSASGTEFAIEGDKWKNGIFTFCMLYGLQKNKADENRDGRIMLSELQNYLGKEVMRISGGLQCPTSRSENILNDILIK